MEENLFDVLAKEEISYTNGTHPLCIRKRFLLRVIKIADYVGMIRHMMMVIVLCINLPTRERNQSTSLIDNQGAISQNIKMVSLAIVVIVEIATQNRE